jgi:hypothetical protein
MPNADLRVFQAPLQTLIDSGKTRMGLMVNGMAGEQLVEEPIEELIAMVEDYFEAGVKQDPFTIDFASDGPRVVAEPVFESGVEKTSFSFYLPAYGDPRVLEYTPEHLGRPLSGLLHVGEGEVWLTYKSERLDEQELKSLFAADAQRLAAVLQDLNDSIDLINRRVAQDARELVAARKKRAEQNRQLAQSLEAELRSPS